MPYLYVNSEKEPYTYQKLAHYLLPWSWENGQTLNSIISNSDVNIFSDRPRPKNKKHFPVVHQQRRPRKTLHPVPRAPVTMRHPQPKNKVRPVLNILFDWGMLLLHLNFSTKSEKNKEPLAEFE